MDTIISEELQQIFLTAACISKGALAWLHKPTTILKDFVTHPYFVYLPGITHPYYP